MRRIFRAPSLWLFLLALVPRLLYLASIPSTAIVESVDAQGYDLLARNLQAGHGFSLRAIPPYQPDGLRTPLYPAFIAATYALTGSYPVAVAVAQAIVDSLTALLVGGLGRALWGRRVGLASAVLYALTPLQWRYAAALLTEIPLAFLITLAVWLWAKRSPPPRIISNCRGDRKGCPYKRLSSKGQALTCGAVAGLAALCKPNASGLALIWALGTLWALRAERRRALASAGSLLLAAVAVASPWLIRNGLVFGEPFLSNAHLGLVGRVSAPATLGVVRGDQVPPWSPEWEQRYVEVVSQAAARHDWQLPADALTPRQAYAREKQIAEAAWEVVRAYPLEALQAHLLGFVRSWAPQEQVFWYVHLSGQPWEETGVAPNAYRDALEILCDGRPGEAFEWAFVRPRERLDPWGRLVWHGWGLAHLLGGGLVLVGWRRLRRRPALAFGLAATILYATLPPGPIGYERFRVPVMPLITVLQVAGVAWLGLRLRQKNG